MRYSDFCKQRGLEPDPAVAQLLADAGELIIGGQQVTAEPAAPEKPKAKSPTEKEGE